MSWSSSSSRANTVNASTLSVRPTRGPVHVLMLPDLDRTERIGEFWSYPQVGPSGELLIDCEEDRTLRALLIGMLQERG